jgi:hypothetical protein
MSTEQTKQVLLFKHGSRSVVLVGAFLLASGGGLVYVAVTGPNITSGRSLYYLIMGIILLLTGGKLAFGLERNEFDLSSRRWRSRRGLFKRTTEKGTFEDLEAVVFDHQQRRHGIQYYDSYHVGITRAGGDDLHIEQTTSREYALALARELAMRLGVKFVETDEETDEEPDGE